MAQQCCGENVGLGDIIMHRRNIGDQIRQGTGEKITAGYEKKTDKGMEDKMECKD